MNNNQKDNLELLIIPFLFLIICGDRVHFLKS